jgi:phosphatidate cytidylyltransferase
MSDKIHQFIIRSITGLILFTLFLYTFYFWQPALSFVLAITWWYIACYEWPRIAKNVRASWFLFLFYPTIPFLMLVLLNNTSEYRILLLLSVILASSHDSGAYITGSLIGKHKLIPRISQKKTWEGFIGGIVFTWIALLFWFYARNISAPITFIALFAMLISTIAFAGDLFESWLKRMAHIKDTGTILPGHGGLLDRFDSILACSAFFYVFRKMLITIV